MKSNLFKKTTFILIILIPVLCFSQKNDTIFYGKNNVRSIEVKHKKDKMLVSFFSNKGENLLVNDNFKYSYFDYIMGSFKVVLIENRSIYQEYWISGNDTIYDKAKFDPIVDTQVNRLINYITNHLVYPIYAQSKGITGKVYVSFVVTKTGDITQLKALTKIGYELEDTALNLVAKYGKWGFVKLNKETVNCYFKLPVNFVLQ